MFFDFLFGNNSGEGLNWHDKIYDFNNDGKLDSLEKGAQFATFMNFMEECENELNNTSDYDYDDSDDLEDELEMAGVDVDELSSMSDFEREEAISDAGLDPSDFGDIFD